MFNKKPQTADPQLVLLDAEIERTCESLSVLSAGDEDHARGIDQLVKLHAMRAEFNPRRKPLSSDTLAMIAANISITAMVVGHERARVITTKAHQFLLKAK